MANFTPNYNLKKPLENENYSVNDQNGNMDILDTKIKEVSIKVDNIKVPDGTTTQKGIVQLNNSTTSTSITQAATPNAVKLAMDRANQAFQSASDGKNYIAGKVGNVSGSSTFTQIGDEVQVGKNTISSNLNSKGVSASNNETLRNLANKIANINIDTLNGKKYAYGQVEVSSDRKVFPFVNGGSLTMYYVDIALPFWADNITCNSRTTANGLDGVRLESGNFAYTVATSDNKHTISGYGAFIPIRSGNTVYLPIPSFIITGTTMYWRAYS